MSFWVLLQVLVNLVWLAGIVGMWFKLNRPVKDDPRLSRGLQLLQSKISILEDLSDRTEHQVQQLTHLLEQKAKDVQSHIHKADRQIQNIDNSMNRSLEVAKIFQDKIPHQEIIERQNTVKYVKAARMAHQGASVEEILQSVDLTRGEIEFITKVNRDQLQFSEQDLPEWARDEELSTDENTQENTDETSNESSAMFSAAAQFTTPSIQQDLSESARGSSSEYDRANTPVHPKEKQGHALSQLGDQFRRAMVPGLSESAHFVTRPTTIDPTVASVIVNRPQPKTTLPQSGSPSMNQGRAFNTGEVKRVVFPKVDISKNLG
jgi:mannose/fructose/N-acetylgalactosamine-specific phosphotransferase system component IIB